MNMRMKINNNYRGIFIAALCVLASASIAVQPAYAQFDGGGDYFTTGGGTDYTTTEIGRASCRERV